jgi:hypothetical protein
MLWTEDGRVRPPSPLAVWRAVVISAGLAFIAYDCVAKLRSPTRGAESFAALAAPQAAVTSPKSVRVIEMARNAKSEAEAGPVEPVGVSYAPGGLHTSRLSVLALHPMNAWGEMIHGEG